MLNNSWRRSALLRNPYNHGNTISRAPHNSLPLASTESLAVRCVRLVITMLTTIFLISSVHAQTVDEVRASWRARQGMVRSLSIEWAETSMELITPDEDSETPSAAEVKPVERTYENRGSLLFSGENYYAQTVREHYERGNRKRVVLTSVSDGLRFSFLCDNGASTGIPAANVSPAKERTASFEFRAIFLQYRPDSKKWTEMDVGLLRVRPTRSYLEGKECVVLETPASKEAFQRVYWTDPGRGHSILREQLYAGQALLDQTDVQLAEKVEHGVWPLLGWKVVRFGKSGTPLRSRTARVTRFSINPPTSADDFRTDKYPIGTYVTDKSGGEAVVYIVQANNERRIIQPWEKQLPYETLKNTVTGQGLARESGGLLFGFSLWSLICMVLGIALLVVVAVAILRRTGGNA